MTTMKTHERVRPNNAALMWLFRNHIWLFLGLAVVIFSLSSPYFLTVNNISNVLTQGAFIGILAVGMTLVMIDGEIDLSVGAVLALATALTIGLQEQIGIWPSVFVGLLTGSALGFLNGAITAYSGIHSFIVTLGALIGVRGLVFIYSGEDALMVPDFAYTEYAEIYLGPVSITALIFFALALFFQWVLSSTRHGLETFAIGDNIEAAHDAGINIKRHKIINFTICGTMAAVAGILLSMRLGTAEPNAGKIWELWTIIAVVLGGTRLTGGFGSMWKTIGGVMTLAVLRNGLRLLNTPNYVELMVMGAVLILALLLDSLLSKQAEA
jgi:ribose/xylose/arabinose/galactoside ABC-type transport system permease subunit